MFQYYSEKTMEILQCHRKEKTLLKEKNLYPTLGNFTGNGDLKNSERYLRSNVDEKADQ